jgi:hypothetical protein
MGRWAVLVLALLAAVAIGVFAYQAGVAHGIDLQPPAASASAAPGTPGAAPAVPPPYYPSRYYYGPRFGFFGPLFGILFFFFVLRLFAWGLFGFGWGWRRWRHYDYPYDGPSRFDEWHRRAHERMRDGSAPAPPTA